MSATIKCTVEPRAIASKSLKVAANLLCHELTLLGMEIPVVTAVISSTPFGTPRVVATTPVYSFQNTKPPSLLRVGFRASIGEEGDRIRYVLTKR